MASEWFCRIGGEELGPLSAQQVKTMAAQGRLHPGDSIRRGADGQWMPASRVKGLFPADQPGAEAAAPAAAETPAENKPPVKKIAKALPVAKQPVAAKPAAVSPKKAKESPPAKDVSASPAESKGAAEAEFPAELAGGIPRQRME